MDVSFDQYRSEHKIHTDNDVPFGIFNFANEIPIEREYERYVGMRDGATANGSLQKGLQKKPKKEQSKHEAQIFWVFYV